MKINIVIFSRDRACQLELLIRSMKEFFKEFNEHTINILYKTSNEFFEQGYEKLKKMHSDDNINYIKELHSFQTSLLMIFKQDIPMSIFFVDDNVFKEPFSFEDKEVNYFLNNSKILTLSLRLHPKLTYCYPAKLKQSCPVLDGNNTFDWIGKLGDFGYPMSLDGHIFRTQDLRYYLYNMRYTCPNDLESQMAMRPLPISKMSCYNKSKIINLPLNKVQDYNQNYHGGVTAEFLNEEFLNNKVISLDNIRGFENYSCHQEIEIEMLKQ
jgi:hypothetical protein